MTYFHGSLAEIAVGEELRPGQVGGDYSAATKRVWATASLGMAYAWAARLQRAQRPPVGPVHIYEVELVSPEVDVNALRTDPESVMARGGRVVRKVGTFASKAAFEEFLQR